MSDAIIRPARAGDEPGAYKVCLETGNHGQDGGPLYRDDPDALGRIFVLNAMILTTGSYLLMHWGVIHKPFVNVPWTTPPVIGHYLVSGGDWRAAVWGVASIVIAMVVYFPFAKGAERVRLQTQDRGRPA